MSNRQQLPPQIKKVQITDRSTGKTVVRYQLTVDAGRDQNRVSGARSGGDSPPRPRRAPNSPRSRAA